MNICCGGSDEVVEPSSSMMSPSCSSLLSPFSSSRRSKFSFRKMKSALQIGSSSQQEDLMFVVYGRPRWYEIKAFNKKGDLVPKFCFDIDLSKTLLPHDSGFCSIGATLYIIGGSHVPHGHITTYVSTLDTYKMYFYTIPHFENHLPSNHARLGYVRKGPSLKAYKQAPLVIVVGLRIYVFSRFLHLDDPSHKFEMLDTDVDREGEEEWVGLPEPPFKEDLGIRNVNDFVLTIESHVVYEVHSCVIIHVSGSDHYGVCHGVYKFLLTSRTWVPLSTKTVPFFGKALPLSGFYCALRYNPDFWGNKVSAFVVGTPAATVGEIDRKESLPTLCVEIEDTGTPPKEAHYQALSEIGLLGDTVFIARVGYNSNHEATAKHHFTLDRFQVSMKDGRAKAVNFRRKSYPIKDNGSMFFPTTLYCVPWCNPATRGKC